MKCPVKRQPVSICSVNIMSNKTLFFLPFISTVTTQVIQVINVTLSDDLFLCYWALLQPFIVKGVRNYFMTQATVPVVVASIIIRLFSCMGI